MVLLLHSSRRKALGSYKNGNNGNSKISIGKESIDQVQEKINLITEGIKPFYSKMLKEKIPR